MLGDSSIVARGGAGKRACVSESQSIFENEHDFKTKIHSRKRYSVAQYVGSSPRNMQNGYNWNRERQSGIFITDSSADCQKSMWYPYLSLPKGGLSECCLGIPPTN